MGLEVQSTSFQRPNNNYYAQKRMESPTVTGLIIMFIAEIIIIIGFFTEDILSSYYYYYWPTLSTLGVIGIVLAFIGFMKIYRDRFSFNEPHPKNVSQAFIFYILGIIFSICPFVLMLFFLIKVNEPDISFIRAIFYIVFILSIVGPLLWFIGGYKVLFNFIPVSRKILLKVALYIFIIAIVLSLIQFIIIWSPLHYFSYIIRNLTRNLYLISHIFFAICFFFAYEYQKNNPQLRRSEI